MGQHSVVQREVFSGVVLDVPLTYRILSDVRNGIRGIVEVPKLWLDEKRVGPGIYLVSVTHGRSVVRFFAKYEGDTNYSLMLLAGEWLLSALADQGC